MMARSLTRVLSLLATTLFILTFITTHVNAASCHFGKNTRVADNLFDAENLMQTTDGTRLFLSGGDNIYEILVSNNTATAKDNNDGFTAIPLLPNGSETFHGMSQRGDVLFAVTKSGLLYAARLIPQQKPQLQAVFRLANFSLPNGMAADRFGNLYIADSAYLSGVGRIVKLTFAAGSDWTVTSQTDFTTDVGHPNGLRIMNSRNSSTMFITDLGVVKKIEMIGDSAQTVKAGAITQVYKRFSIFDDLWIVEPQDTTAPLQLLVCDFVRGTVFLLDVATQSVVGETSLELHPGASSVIIGRPPLLPPPTPDSAVMLVTDKGIIGSRLPIGNALDSTPFIRNCKDTK